MKKVQSFFGMTFGCLLMAAGVYFFKIQNGFATGGVTGISMILSQWIPLSPEVLIWILNGLLLLLGFLILGKDTGVKTVYCSMLYSGAAFLLERLVPLDAPLTDEPLLELVYAILLTAFGSALVFQCDASSGGTDIVALILKKYTDIDVGKALLAADFVVAASSFFVFGLKTGLFSLLGLFAKAVLVDSVIESFYVCKYFIVITKKREEISEYIISTLHHGVTVSAVTGEYTKEEKTMIHTVCKRIEAARLRKKIKQIDPEAFVIITTSSEIVGRGFRSV